MVAQRSSTGSGGLPASWELVHAKQLEKGFDLRTCNLGGAHSEHLENRSEHMRRTVHTIIPTYNAFADPHLKRYHRSNGTVHASPAAAVGSLPYTLRAANRPRSAEHKRSALRRRMSTLVTSPRNPTPPQSHICSTEQVLQLKSVFWRHSDQGASGHRAIHVAEPSADGDENFAFIYCCGVNAVNVHRRLHGKLPIRAAYMERLWHVLHLLESADTIDWPHFLLLCTIDVSDDAEYKRLLALKDSFDQYTASNEVTNEREFADLVVHLNGGREIAERSFLRTFFQQGDFYRSRGGFRSFPEAVFCLYEFFTQVYILRARARGTSMTYNFTGHGAPGNVGGPAKWQRGRPRSCPPSLQRQGARSARPTKAQWRP
eukprot:TRINITY_DN26465_c0_g1_i1.p1 TRINITY_DN26465_c0_g1~~TRINITY_DN26465_c0_g1_i1.p1  ORF type:complete len:392 (+),score=100.17 TRINITY_DN26465_c0_g1_i1:60-1178(+)